MEKRIYNNIQEYNKSDAYVMLHDINLLRIFWIFSMYYLVSLNVYIVNNIINFIVKREEMYFIRFISRFYYQVLRKSLKSFKFLITYFDFIRLILANL